MSYDEKFRRHVLKIKEKESLSFAKVAKRFGLGKCRPHASLSATIFSRPQPYREKVGSGQGAKAQTCWISGGPL